MLITSADDLAKYVTSLRKKKKLTQVEVADQVGLMQATVSSFENMPERTKIETLFRIFSAVGIEIHLVPKGEDSASKTWKEDW